MKKNTCFDNDLVSIIIPTYNCELTIQDTINSVIHQTYKNIEILIIDDFSTDETEKIVSSFQMNDDRIFFYKQNVNMGAGIARNKGLELAKGRYVAFLDSDDTWYDTKIDLQVDLLNKKNGYFSFTAIQMIDSKNNIIKTKRKIKDEIDYKFLLRNTMIATSSVIIDRHFFGDFRMSERRKGQDYSTWLKLLKCGVKAYGINEVLVNYRTGNKKSLSGNKWNSVKQVWEIQVQDEKISKINALINVSCFVVNGFKKYVL